MTTLSDSEVGTSEFEGAPAERETGAGATSEVTQREILRSVARYLTPPDILRGTPDSLPKMREYAHRGEQVAKRGTLRALGIGYFRAVARPAAVVCRSVEWIAVRPGRALTVFATWKLVITTGPGPWIVHHIIDPALHLAGWVFL